MSLVHVVGLFWACFFFLSNYLLWNWLRFCGKNFFLLLCTKIWQAWNSCCQIFGKLIKTEGKRQYTVEKPKYTTSTPQVRPKYSQSTAQVWPKYTLSTPQVHVMDVFSSCNYHNASREYFWPKKISKFMHGIKSAILAKLKNCQNGTFEPGHEIQKKFWPEAFF